MRIGYTRVSTTERKLDLKRDALKRARCEKILAKAILATVSGFRAVSPQPPNYVGEPGIYPGRSVIDGDIDFLVQVLP